MPKEIRVNVPTPTHAITTDGTTPESQIGYSTLPELKAEMSFGTAADADSTDFATAGQGDNADTAYSWGNHSLSGYVTDNSERLLKTEGTANLFAGSETNYALTHGVYNVAFGDFAGKWNSTGSLNVFVGVSAGGTSSTGSFNTYVGMNAGAEATFGSNNTSVGSEAGGGNTTGSNNTFIGKSAGQYFGAASDDNAVATKSIMVGNSPRASASGNTNETVIGVDVIGAGSHTVTIGNDDTTLQVLNAHTLRLAKKRTITSATEAGVMGDICWDDDYLYVCTATDTWKRTALATW